MMRGRSPTAWLDHRKWLRELVPGRQIMIDAGRANLASSVS
jgi:hypothetical protein